MTVSGDRTHVTGTVTRHFEVTVTLGLTDMIGGHEPALIRAAWSTCFGATIGRGEKLSEHLSHPHLHDLSLDSPPVPPPTHLHCALGASLQVGVQQGSLLAHTAGSGDWQSHSSPSSMMPFPHVAFSPGEGESEPQVQGSGVEGLQQAALTQ